MDHSKLQDQLMEIINFMIEVKCELPEGLKFFYKIKEENRQIQVTSYLTKESALKSYRWYHSDSSSYDSIEEDDTIIYREQVGKAKIEIIRYL
jgi:hypothetical protein